MFPRKSVDAKISLKQVLSLVLFLIFIKPFELSISFQEVFSSEDIVNKYPMTKNKPIYHVED